MNKKILIFSISAVFMLVTITFATAVSSNTNKTVEKRESPLFGIRTKLAIGEKLENLKENIRAKFVGERIFFLPFQWLRNIDGIGARDRILQKCIPTAGFPVCTYEWPTTC